MTIAIVEDSAKDITTLYTHISRYCSEHKTHMQINTFTAEDDFLQSLKTEKYNLAFLDIFMPDSSGIHTAKELRKLCPKCQIIFCTSSNDHAVKAFRLHALDYLMKPYTYAQLEDALNRYENIAERFSHYIELKEGRYQTRILVTDIMYVDYHNHYIQVHTTSSVIRSYMPFSNFSPLLTPYSQFLWCYRNCIVNMDYVESWEDTDFILKNGEHIPIFKTCKRQILQAYANYVFEYVNGGIKS